MGKRIRQVRYTEKKNAGNKGTKACNPMILVQEFFLLHHAACCWLMEPSSMLTKQKPNIMKNWYLKQNSNNG